MNSEVLSQFSHFAPLPVKAMSNTWTSVPQPERSEFDLPPGAAHARTVGPAAGWHRGAGAGGAVWANQPKVVLRGRRRDITVNGHSSGRE